MIILNGNGRFRCGNADVSVPSAFTELLPGLTPFVQGEKLVAGETARHPGPRNPNDRGVSGAVGAHGLCSVTAGWLFTLRHQPRLLPTSLNVGSHSTHPAVSSALPSTLRSQVCPRWGPCQASFLFIQCCLVPTAFHCNFFLLIYI